MQLFYLFLFMCLCSNVASNYTYKATWRIEKICHIYQYDFKKCHPCDKRLCGPPKIKANINCQIFTCLSDLPIPTPTTSTSTTSTSTTTTLTTTTTPTTTIATTTSTTTTTASITTNPRYTTFDCVKMAT